MNSLHVYCLIDQHCTSGALCGKGTFEEETVEEGLRDDCCGNSGLVKDVGDSGDGCGFEDPKVSPDCSTGSRQLDRCSSINISCYGGKESRVLHCCVDCGAHRHHNCPGGKEAPIREDSGRFFRVSGDSDDVCGFTKECGDHVAGEDVGE